MEKIDESKIEVPPIILEDHLKFDNESTKLFYSLPLNDAQRKELYEYIMKMYKEHGPDIFKEEEKEKDTIKK